MLIEVTSENFDQEVITSERPVLVNFWGPRCGPCLALMPKVEELENKYKGKIKVSKVDASKNKKLCLNLKIMGLPTFLLFKGGIEVDRLSGGDLKIEDIEESIKKIID